MKYKVISRALKERKLVPLTYNINDFIGDDVNSDYYESIYQYGEEHKKIWDETGSLAGITGLITKKLVFDFDSSKDIEYSRKDAVELVSRLVHSGVSSDQMQITFSGSKGFHVEINTTEEFTRKQFENTVKNLAEGLETFDPKIVDENRIFRVALTKHPKTKAYKIPLTIDQLATMPIDAIQSMAKNTDDATWNNFCTMTEFASQTEVDLPANIKSFKNLSEKEKKLVDQNLSLDDKPNMNNKPKHMSAARYTLQQGFFEAGERHEAYMILAATYRALGYDKEIAYNMLKATNRMQAKRTGQEPFSTDEMWLSVVGSVYSPTWKGAVYSEKENALLIKTISKYSLQVEATKETKISMIDDVSNRFTSFAENIDKNRVMTGIPYIDEDVVLTTGMLVGWLGAPSSGKTSHVLNIVEHNAMNGNHCFFGSHDMYDSLLYTRLLQKYANYDMMTILDMMKKRNPTKELRNAFETVKNNFANVGFNFQSGPTVEDIGRSIDEYQDKKGEKLRLVVVDYLEKITGQYSDATANSGYNAARLADLAKDKEVCLILLLQPQKSAGDPSDPLLSYRKIKGASVIEQDARVILTNWRPGFDPNNDNKDDKYATIAVVKNNMGPVGKYEFAWDGISGRIREMTMDEVEDQKRVVNAATERKKKVEDAF